MHEYLFVCTVSHRAWFFCTFFQANWRFRLTIPCTSTVLALFCSSLLSTKKDASVFTTSASFNVSVKSHSKDKALAEKTQARALKYYVLQSIGAIQGRRGGYWNALLRAPLTDFLLAAQKPQMLLPCWIYCLHIFKRSGILTKDINFVIFLQISNVWWFHRAYVHQVGNGRYQTGTAMRILSYQQRTFSAWDKIFFRQFRFWMRREDVKKKRLWQQV